MNGVEMMNSAFGSSGSFGSRVRSTCFGHNKYRGIRRNFHSKPYVNMPDEIGRAC